MVLEAPSMGMSAVWGWIRQDLTSRTRACAYDRSGLGWSEAGDSDYDPSRAIDELHLLLERATEAGPFVLVGHEFGAALATAYATRYRADLAAVVLIDPPAENGGLDQSSMMRFADSWPWLARVGVLRLTRMLSRRADGLPETSEAAVSAFLNRPDHLTRSARELSRWNDTVRLGFRRPARCGSARSSARGRGDRTIRGPERLRSGPRRLHRNCEPGPRGADQSTGCRHPDTSRPLVCAHADRQRGAERRRHTGSGLEPDFVSASGKDDSGSAGRTNRRTLGRTAATAEQRTDRCPCACPNRDLRCIFTLGGLSLVYQRRRADLVPHTARVSESKR